MALPRFMRMRLPLMIGLGAGLLLASVFTVVAVLMVQNARQTQETYTYLDQSEQATQVISTWRLALWSVMVAEQDIIFTGNTDKLPLLDQQIEAVRRASDAYDLVAVNNPRLARMSERYGPQIRKWINEVAGFSAALHQRTDPKAAAAYLRTVRSQGVLDVGEVVLSSLQAIRELRDADALAVRAELQQWRSKAIWWLLVGANMLLMTITVGAGLVVLIVFERRRSAANLKEAGARMLAADIARSGFLAAASHDLRQPLQAMILFTSALRRRVSDNVYVGSLVDGISSSVLSLERMFNGLLDISKLDAGAVAADRTDFPIDRLLRNLEVEFAALAAAKGLDFQIVGDGVLVHTDPVLLESMVRNILANAIKYTKQGHVVVTCRVDVGHSLVIEISDTGIGIPDIEHESIFREFHRVVTSGDTEEGLGLGLAIVGRLSKLLGVSVELHSIRGVGSTFSLSVPLSLSSEAQPIQVSSRAPAAPPGQIRVLLVDDDPLVREAVRLTLIEHGMVVTSFASAAAVIAMFEDGSNRATFDVALIDYNLGADTTGVALLDRLAVQYGVALPALVMTGEQSPDILEELGDSGYIWLQKPVDSAMLIRALRGMVAAHADTAPVDLLSALQNSTTVFGATPRISLTNGKASLVS